MFEKEAEEYAEKSKSNFVVNEYGSTVFTQLDIEQAFQDGAEFGYNKAKEEDKWHYPQKGEYPDENKLVLIYAKNEEGYGHDFMTYHKDNGWYGYGTYIEEVIAWKELDIPKESE